MKIALRLLLALSVALVLAACKTTPEPEEPAAPAEPSVQEPAEEVVTQAAPDPRDYTDPRNFDNSESLLSKRVIYFDFDKSDVKSEFRATLAAHAAYMRANSSARVTLEGHADERGTREYNLALGARRAEAARSYLISQGVAASRITTISYGKERPEALCSAETCWSQNRRAVTMVSGAPAS